MYVDAAYCYRWTSVDCLSVRIVSPAKTAQPIEMPLGCGLKWTQEIMLLDGVQIPPWERAIFGGKGRPLYSIGTLCGHLCEKHLNQS